MYSVVLPIAGYPTNNTRWGFPSERGAGTRGVEVGTKGGPAGSVHVNETYTTMFTEGWDAVRTANRKGRWMKPCERIVRGGFFEEIFL